MATLALPRQSLVAMSSKMAVFISSSMARQIGLVAKRPSEPLYGVRRENDLSH